MHSEYEKALIECIGIIHELMDENKRLRDLMGRPTGVLRENARSVISGGGMSGAPEPHLTGGAANG